MSGESLWAYTEESVQEWHVGTGATILARILGTMILKNCKTQNEGNVKIYLKHLMFYYIKPEIFRPPKGYI